MKVGLIIYGSLGTVSGGYLYDRQLVEHLRQRRDEVTVFSLPSSSYGRHLGHNFFRRFARQLVRADLDILLQDELNHPSLFLLNRWLKRRVTYPIISIVHHLRISEDHPWWLNWFYRLVEGAYLKSVTGFVFNSQVTRRVVTNWVEPRPFTVATPGGDRFRCGLSEQEIKVRAHEPGPLRLLFVGNVIPRKGLHTLLAAVSTLPPEMWCLNVVGDTAVDPPYFQKLQRQIAQHRMADKVTWHGRCEGESVVAKMASSQILVVPSQYEGFGIVYLEGMGFGLPAIATSAGGAKEIIKDNVSGFLLPVGDVDLLARRLRQLHEDRQRLEKMSLQAKKLFTRQPGWEVTTSTIRRFLLEMSQ